MDEGAISGSGGLITFVFTDVVGSTAAWEAHPEDMAVALARHDALIEDLVVSHGGQVVRPRGEGDSRFVVFTDALAALDAAAAVTDVLASEPWPEATPIVVRCAVHSGQADERAGDYYGSAVNRCARLRGIANPGQVLASEVTVELARASGPVPLTLIDLGVHWLKDLAHPERVFQVEPAGRATSFAPLHSLAPGTDRAALLPEPGTSFIGRADEVAALAAQVTSPARRLITLSGPGGVGKTRVALAVAAEVAHSFPGGASFVDLTSVTDPQLLVPTLAESLGVTEGPGEDPIAALATRLGPSPTLLILDNFEQLVAAAPTIGALVAAAPELTVLVTSRAALRVSGELEHPLAPMPIPDLTGTITPEAIASSGAVALFVARCQAQRPDFDLTPDNARAIAEICVRLDGLPLALELASARIKILDPPDLLARLDRQLRFLVGGDRDAPDRQRTVRATIEWSHQLLSADEQQLLARLGVFAESFTLDAAEAVGTSDHADADVLDLVSALVDNSLVRPVDDSTRLRFRLLQSVREFALERLEGSGGGDGARTAHGRFFGDLVARESARLDGPDAAQASNELRAAEPDIRAALAHLTEHDPGAAARMAVGLRPFWVTHGRLDEGRRAVGAVLAAGGFDDGLRGALLVEAGVLATYQDATTEATSLLDAGLLFADEAGPSGAATAALAHCFSSRVRLSLGELDGARRHAEAARALASEHHLYEPHVQALALMAMLAGISGDVDRERDLHAERLTMARARQDTARIADAQNTLAEIALDEGDLATARTAAAEAATLARGTSRLTARDALLTQSRVALADRDARQAAEALTEALALSIEFGQPFELALCLRCVGAAAAVAGDPFAAARSFGAAGQLRPADGDVFPVEGDLEEFVDEARSAAGAEAFESSWAAGAALEQRRAFDEAAALLTRLTATAG